MNKNNSGYSYDHTRRLGALIPLEVETKKNNDIKIPQLIINKIKIARNEPSWTENDIRILRAASLCKLSHFYRAMVATLTDQKREVVLKTMNINRENIVLEIMKGLSVDEAFRKCCGELNF